MLCRWWWCCSCWSRVFLAVAIIPKSTSSSFCCCCCCRFGSGMPCVCVHVVVCKHTYFLGFYECINSFVRLYINGLFIQYDFVFYLFDSFFSRFSTLHYRSYKNVIKILLNWKYISMMYKINYKQTRVFGGKITILVVFWFFIS